MRIIAWKECDGNELVELRKRCEANAVVAEIERGVYVLQEHIADDPDTSCIP